MEKAQRKKEARIQRQLAQEKKRRNMRIMVWSLSGLFVLLIAALIVFWPKPAPLSFEYDKSPLLGNADAKVKIMEFGDFKCPTCAYFSQNIMSKIKTEYIDTGKASLSFQNWTIIGPDSTTAALAGLAIYHQNNDAFWKFYDALYTNQPPESESWATVDYLVDTAKKQNLGIDYDLLRKDIENKTYADELAAQNNFAVAHNFTGTPSVLVNGKKLDDNTALNYDNLKAAIDKALKEADK
ncbi:DsbA family protein [Cohnella candidum]|uniref:DsbA family protein n=1 Tax=Cohnella candidum TaxID=2674991 RepID=A0A3G3JW89_9BACL|nr:thioredoxin domain-containing protein [Cohnella candidum]AYQ71769.1 DsbA family protein [Cohnella candidum]